MDMLQVEIRAFLERARPIDKRLRYQMDKLLQAAAAVQPGAGAAAGAILFRHHA